MRAGSEFARFHDTGNGPNFTVLKALGKEIVKKCFGLSRIAWKTTSGGPKRKKTASRKFAYEHKISDQELNSTESDVCGPYSCLQLVKLLLKYDALPEGLFLILVDWGADCLLCEGDIANSHRWTTQMKASRLHNNSIREGLARHLIHVPGDGDGMWSNFHLPLTLTYANLSPVLFLLFCHSPKC